MPLANLLAPGRVALLDQPLDPRGMLAAAAALLAADDLDAERLFASLAQREHMGSTAIGHGVAIPHGRIDGLGAARGAFLRLSSAVDCQASDGEPVDLVFAMAVPERFNQEHLQSLSELAERFGDPGFRDALRACPDAASMHALLTARAAPMPA